MKRAILYCVSIAFFTSCGYRLDEIPSKAEAPTISIPYVDGDIDGQLTAAITKELASSGVYDYRLEGGEWLLKMAIVDGYEENIGFRYDRSRKGKLQDWVIPVETREGIVVEVALIYAGSGTIQKGPIRIKAESEYDHDYYTIRNQVNVFSLGQLTDVDTAEEIAVSALYKKVAEKIVDWVIYGL